jgi:hypothetical protein
MGDLVRWLETIVQPQLEQFADDLRARYPNVKFFVSNFAVGSLTSYQGHSACLEALLPHNDPSWADNLALMVEVCQLTIIPKIQADVCWGHEGGPVGAPTEYVSFPEEWSSNDDWPEATPEMRAKVLENLPRLMTAFEENVQAGLLALRQRAD